MKKQRRDAIRYIAWRIVSLPLLSIAIFLIVEFCNRRSFERLFLFLTERPAMCGINVMIILATLLFSELFPRRRAFLSAIAILWIGFGITNYIVICFRVQPFTFADIQQLRDGIALMTVYFKWYQIILIFVAGFAIVAGLVLLFTKVKKRRVDYTRSAILFVGAVMGCMLTCTLSINAGYLPRRFENLVVAYDEYGFAYCFVNSISQFGIDKPVDYSGEVVTNILEEIPEEEPQPTALVGAPNVLFVQLESFFDVNNLVDSRFSENPIPNYTELMEKWPSGELYVPSVGGGTANTEFEILTGMCLDFFGAGEYPYNTVLQETTCETICYNLAAYDYVSTAIHNYTGTFYDRNSVYSRLGFDHFVSLEYIPDAKYNSIGWCSDSVLTREMIKAMKATEQRDFIFTITVQTHGKYADTLLPDSDRIQVLSAPENIYFEQLTNYVNALYRTDAFIKELLDAFTLLDEPVVVVFYGDHLPAVGLDADMLKDGNLYETQYVIWNNYGADFTAENMEAYQLSANILEQMGMEGGVICRYHQTAADKHSKDYLEQLEILEYDTLYGNLEVYDGVNPYQATELTMGSVPISIDSVTMEYGRILVEGRNFTEFSRILVNDSMLDTIYVDSGALVAILPKQEEPVEVCVAQVSSEKRELGRTDLVVVEP